MEQHWIHREDKWAGIRRVSFGVDPGLTRCGIAVVGEIDTPGGPEPLFGATDSARELDRQRLVQTGRRLRVLAAATIGQPTIKPPEETARAGEWRVDATQPMWTRIAALLAWLQAWLQTLPPFEPSCLSLVLETASPQSMGFARDDLSAVNGAIAGVFLAWGVPASRVFTASGKAKFTVGTHMLLGLRSPPTKETDRKARKRQGARMLLEWSELVGAGLKYDPNRERNWDGLDAVLLGMQAWRPVGNYFPSVAVRDELSRRAGEEPPPKRARRTFDPNLPLTYQLW